MTPRITNKKLEMIARDLEKARGIVSVSRQKLVDMCVGDTKAADAYRIKLLADEVAVLDNVKLTLGFSAESILLRRKSEVF